MRSPNWSMELGIVSDEPKPQAVSPHPSVPVRRTGLTNLTYNLEANHILMLKFYEAQAMFKAGYVEAGCLALSILTQCYYILPGGKHISTNEKESEEFINSMDELRRDLLTYARDNSNNGNVRKIRTTNGLELNYLLVYNFSEIDNRFDKIVRQYYIILNRFGFCP